MPTLHGNIEIEEGELRKEARKAACRMGLHAHYHLEHWIDIAVG